jgi:hypothetical protein
MRFVLMKRVFLCVPVAHRDDLPRLADEAAHET